MLATLEQTPVERALAACLQVPALTLQSQDVVAHDSTDDHHDDGQNAAAGQDDQRDEPLGKAGARAAQLQGMSTVWVPSCEVQSRC